MAKKKTDDTSDETLGAEASMTDEPMLGKAHADEPEMGAAERLRAFEDEKLGVDAVRIHDKVERGVGSPFFKLSDEDKARYAALERLVETEKALAAAHAALIAAQEAHEAAYAAAA